MSARARLTWIESNGGPLVLLPDHLRDHWVGIGEGGWEPGSGTDYDRACEVSDWVGLVQVGSGDAVVLGEEPALTGVLATPPGALLLRWIYAPAGWGPPDPGDLLDRTWERFAVWLVESPTQVIQDAAFGGRDIDAERLVLSLRPGRYDVLSAEYRPSSEVFMILHWLRESKRDELLERPRG